MIRRSDPEIYQRRPDRPLWVPEIDPEQEESFGPYRDTWLLIDVDLEEAVDCVANEERVMAVVDAQASDDVSFELTCLGIEHADDDADEESDQWGYGLDIGVAGLV